jgi:hypothetical protein
MKRHPRDDMPKKKNVTHYKGDVQKLTRHSRGDVLKILNVTNKE